MTGGLAYGSGYLVLDRELAGQALPYGPIEFPIVSLMMSTPVTFPLDRGPLLVNIFG